MMRMTMRQLLAYYKQIDRLEAMESLRRIRDVTVPHMSASKQEEVHRELSGIVESRPRPQRLIVGADVAELNQNLAAFLRGK